MFHHLNIFTYIYQAISYHETVYQIPAKVSTVVICRIPVKLTRTNYYEQERNGCNNHKQEHVFLTTNHKTKIYY